MASAVDHKILPQKLKQLLLRIGIHESTNFIVVTILPIAIFLRLVYPILLKFLHSHSVSRKVHKALPDLMRFLPLQQQVDLPMAICFTIIMEKLEQWLLAIFILMQLLAQKRLTIFQNKINYRPMGFHRSIFFQ